MDNVIQVLSSLAINEGFNPSNIEGVNVFKASQHYISEPITYAQGIIFILQGSEDVYLGGQKYVYDEQNYLVIPVPIIAECKILATSTNPMLAIALDIDLEQLTKIVYELNQVESFKHQLKGIETEQTSRGIFVSPIVDDIQATLCRLILMLNNPQESALLGKQTLRELLYRVLVSNQGREFYQLTLMDTDLARIDQALKWMHQFYDQSISITELASKVNMGESTFHRVFKRITQHSPGQYLKKLRLDKAKVLLEEKGCQVQEAAFYTGYKSTTQFAREFKRLYGKSPSDYLKP